MRKDKKVVEVVEPIVEPVVEVEVVEEVVVENADKEFKSTSAHIRFLFDSGMKQSAIAKQLGVRDQFVSNVVRKYKAEKVVEVEPVVEE